MKTQKDDEEETNGSGGLACLLSSELFARSFASSGFTSGLLRDNDDEIKHASNER
jgi:hypothetical protein